MAGMPDAKGMKMIVDLSKVRGDAANSKADIKKLGTTQKIAGLSCDDYQITDENGKSVKACITSSLGRFVLADMSGGMGRRGGGGGQPAWAKAFGDRPAFPLKVWSDDGNTNLEVTSVDRGPVAASLFEIPDGYVDMGSTMGNDAEFDAVVGELRAGRLIPPVDSVYALDEGRAAFERLASGEHFGKVVIKVS